MFGKKKIEDLEKRLDRLEERLDRLEERQRSFIEHIDVIIKKLTKEGKEHFAWEIRKEEFELMEEGKKISKIRNIIN